MALAMTLAKALARTLGGFIRPYEALQGLSLKGLIRTLRAL